MRTKFGGWWKESEVRDGRTIHGLTVCESCAVRDGLNKPMVIAGSRDCESCRGPLDEFRAGHRPGA